VRRGPSRRRDPADPRLSEIVEPARRLQRVDEDRERPGADALLQQHDHVEVQGIAGHNRHRPGPLALGIGDQGIGNRIEGRPG
jgi:hypothetical protein